MFNRYSLLLMYMMAYPFHDNISLNITKPTSCVLFGGFFVMPWFIFGGVFCCWRGREMLGKINVLSAFKLHKFRKWCRIIKAGGFTKVILTIF